ncbi:hypothetical protein Avi_3134 [Allorhizobium ampelinum S4]|uniref:Uncharacterized protein n=1 Tax=Allorhizobium ampelinum (strain ATCC BAA-846 / DSM 112012 / S4) TaxID=311402 RepID=B9JZ01_ALLAM|nr:hypothetical protein Avi_3134 [Allorhizobium ampelinum S4]
MRPRQFIDNGEGRQAGKVQAGNCRKLCLQRREILVFHARMWPHDDGPIRQPAHVASGCHQPLPNIHATHGRVSGNLPDDQHMLTSAAIGLQSNVQCGALLFPAVRRAIGITEITLAGQGTVKGDPVKIMLEFIQAAAMSKQGMIPVKRSLAGLTPPESDLDRQQRPLMLNGNSGAQGMDRRRVTPERSEDHGDVAGFIARVLHERHAKRRMRMFRKGLEGEFLLGCPKHIDVYRIRYLHFGVLLPVTRQSPGCKVPGFQTTDHKPVIVTGPINSCLYSLDNSDFSQFSLKRNADTPVFLNRPSQPRTNL